MRVSDKGLYVSMKETIKFYYTNDLHSYFDHWPRVATYLKTKRYESEMNNESYWTFDIGDHMDRVHPITEATMGKANVELLNNLQYDFATIGNNEGITLSHQHLYHLYDDANFDLICSNLECMITEDPNWLLKSQTIHSRQGVKIGLIGLTARFNPYYHLLGWNVESPYKAIERELVQLHDCDIVVLLSHVGIHLDQVIAERYEAIDVIIGSHTHHLFHEGEFVNQTILTAAGKHCEYVGEVTLIYDHERKKLVDKQAIVENITSLPKDLSTEQRLLELQEEAAVILQKKIIHTKEPIKSRWYQETEIMKQLTEKVRTWTKADIGMLNAGLLIEGFPKGDITYEDVHRICPHPINVCTVELNGDELSEVVEDAFSKQLMELKLKGFGFRGDIVGRMVFAHLDVQTDFDDNGEEYVVGVLYEGEVLQPERMYQIATADMFTFGRLLPGVASAPINRLFLPEFIRELLVQTLIESQGN